MAFPTVTERYGSLSATGFAKETVFGTPVTANSFLPMMSNSMDLDPGWFSPHVMQNNRALQIYNLYGEAKYVGAINGPLFPLNGIQFLTGAIGFDAQVGYGVYGTPQTTAAVSTTITANIAIGATTFLVTSATGFEVGQTVSVGPGINAETKRISNISGLTITVDSSFTFIHYSGETATTLGLTSTTISAPITAGATTFTVASATGFAIGQFVIVDTGLNAERRRITNVVTTTITVDQAFFFNHSSGVAADTAATTTLSALATAPTNSVTVTSATGITTGTIIQIDTNSPTGGFTAETRKVTNVAGSVLTLDQNLTYNHASGATVTIVVAPFTHTVLDAQSLSSFTVEKNIGGYQSLQFAGCKIGKLDIKAPVGSNPIDITADMTGQSVQILSTPTAVSVANENPFVFAEATLTTFNGLRNEVRNVNISIDNGLKSTYTYSGNHGPGFITPVTLHVSGSFETVWSSLNDATYGDFTNMLNGTLGSLSLTFTHPNGLGSVQLFLPQIVLAKYTNDIKMEDVVMSTINFEATKPVTGNYLNTITAIVANTQYLPL